MNAPCDRHYRHPGSQCDAEGVPIDAAAARCLCYLPPHHDGPHWDAQDGHWLAGEHGHVIPLPPCESTA